MKSNLVGIVGLCLVVGLLGCGKNGIGGKPKPSKDDILSKLQSEAPPYIKVKDVEYELFDSPSIPNGWNITVKFVISPKEPLYSLPSTTEAEKINQLVNQYNEVIQWRNKFVSSEAGHNKANLTVPPLSRPNFVRLAQQANSSISIYGKMIAEKLVDHWNFEIIEIEKPISSVGDSISQFPKGSVAINTPEGEEALNKLRLDVEAAIQFKKDSLEKIENEEKARTETNQKLLASVLSSPSVYLGQYTTGGEDFPFKIKFSNYFPDTSKFNGEIEFPVSGYSMSFDGEKVGDIAVLKNMKTINAVRSFKPDNNWTFKADETGKFVGQAQADFGKNKITINSTPQ